MRFCRKLVVLALSAGVLVPMGLSTPIARAGDGCPPPEVPPNGGEGVVYKTLPDGTDITLDVYLPTAGTPPFPALVIVHGGVWKDGCKESVAHEAAVARDDGFAVFNVDYRLACRPSNPPPGIDAGLCGYHAIAPVIDVGDAVSWIRQNADAYDADASKVGVLGFSTGGNISYMAGTEGSLVPGDTMADAAAAWSGTTELGYLADGTTVACSLSSNPKSCTSSRTTYVGCSLNQCPGQWESASPYPELTPGDASLFIANSKRELVAMREALDFHKRAGNVGVSSTLCSVPGKKHARSYEDRYCKEDSMLTVFERTLAWFHDQLG